MHFLACFSCGFIEHITPVDAEVLALLLSLDVLCYCECGGPQQVIEIEFAPVRQTMDAWRQDCDARRGA